MAGAKFPDRKEDFEHDDRVNYYPEDGKWILEDQTGAEWEWVEETSKWIPAIDQEDIAHQQQAYGADDGVTAEDEFKNKKRKMQEEAKRDPAANKKQKAEKANTAVYVTSIPLDATIDEIYQVFNKYGLVAEEVDSDRPRIKMYTDSEGNFKGDALVVYFRPESVDLAIQMLDESDFRWGAKGPDGLMRVKAADTSYKKTKQEGVASANRSGTSTPVPGRRGRKGDKQKIIEKTQRLNQRLADWSDDEDGGAILNPEVKKEVKKASKYDKVVVLKHMFTPAGLAAELKDDPEAKDWLMEDVKEECVKSGEVLEMTVWDAEEDGVMTVKFGDSAHADDCVQKLNGKPWDGRKCIAEIWDGTKYKKAEVDEEEEKRRLDAFAERIENMPA